MAPTPVPPIRAARGWRAHSRRSRPHRSTPRCTERRVRSAVRGEWWETEIVGAAPARPMADHEIRIVAPPDAAVVARQRLAHVVVLVAEIKAQDGATHVNVGCDVYQLVAAQAEPLRPERHHLHEPDGARGRDRPAVEAA